MKLKKLISVLAIASCGFALLLIPGCGNGPLLRSEDGITGIPAGVARENQSLRPRRNPVSIGDSIPEFVLLDQRDREVSTNELRMGKGSVLLFIPGVNSPDARPAYDWARRHQRFLDQHGLEVLFITPDDVDANLRVVQERDLRMAVLSDPGGWVAMAFGIVPQGRRSPRNTNLYLLGPDGRAHYASTTLPAPSELVVAATTTPGRPRTPFFDF
ncbi:MAG: redoxin domain-containing protein [Candidatus Sumerlaeia bacterium]|nr:redoxin domain-containing protein [Candidatus Sumerlaeia bacterium]